jgi:hypothetical protein
LDFHLSKEQEVQCTQVLRHNNAQYKTAKDFIGIVRSYKRTMRSHGRTTRGNKDESKVQNEEDGKL